METRQPRTAAKERCSRMSYVPETYKCDHEGCEQVHTETNGWLAVEYIPGAFLGVRAWSYANSYPMELREYKHFCGVAHAQIFISQQLYNLLEMKGARQ